VATPALLQADVSSVSAGSGAVNAGVADAIFNPTLVGAQAGNQSAGSTQQSLQTAPASSPNLLAQVGTQSAADSLSAIVASTSSGNKSDQTATDSLFAQFSGNQALFSIA
jgi:hypothetical protein